MVGFVVWTPPHQPPIPLEISVAVIPPPLFGISLGWIWLLYGTTHLCSLLIDVWVVKQNIENLFLKVTFRTETIQILFKWKRRETLLSHFFRVSLLLDHKRTDQATLLTMQRKCLCWMPQRELGRSKAIHIVQTALHQVSFKIQLFNCEKAFVY